MSTLRLGPTTAGVRAVVEVMILPAGKTAAEIFPHLAPDCVEGRDGIGQGWTTADGGETFAAPVAPTPTVEHLLAYAKRRRIVAEAAGVVVAGVKVATGVESESRIANAYSLAEAAQVATVKFKSASGWIELTLDQLKAVRLAVGAHMQACFAAEDAADAGITASPATITTFAEVDAAFAGLTPAA